MTFFLKLQILMRHSVGMILLTGCAGKSNILSRVWEYSPITRAKQAGKKSSPALAAGMAVLFKVNPLQISDPFFTLS